MATWRHVSPSVSRVADAAVVARAAGAAVLLDALHIQRGGSSVDDVRALDPDLVPCIQLCDGPLAVPASLPLPAELPLGMTADATVPSARAVPLSMNQGRPIVIDSPTSPVARELVKLAYAISGRDDDSARRSRLLRRRK